MVKVTAVVGTLAAVGMLVAVTLEESAQDIPAVRLEVSRMWV